VVIASQLQEADDKRLGRVLKAASVLGEGTIVWLASHFPGEHKKAIAWLNTISSHIKFFCVEIEVVRIADSAPVPQLHLVLKPDDQEEA
jgi:hypothetical protein